jgi:hypothetical protein
VPDGQDGERSIREIVGTLRRRFLERRHADTSLAQWRELQLEILAVAKRLQQIARDQEASADRTCGELWVMLGDAFWMERDLSRLSVLIEEVIDEMERHDKT